MAFVASVRWSAYCGCGIVGGKFLQATAGATSNRMYWLNRNRGPHLGGTRAAKAARFCSPAPAGMLGGDHRGRAVADAAALKMAEDSR